MILLRFMAHIKPSIFKNILLEIEKALPIFSIFEKIFLKIDDLMCAFRSYINQTHLFKRGKNTTRD